MWQYIKSREFWMIILGGILLAVLLFVLFFFVFLRNYTRYGVEDKVPQVVGLHWKKATQKIESSGFKPVIDDSTYVPDKEPGAVISQDPFGEDRMAKPGRPIHLIVNKVHPPVVAFPKGIIFASNYNARQKLEQLGLEVVRVKPIPHQHKNLVLGVLRNGKKIQEGDSIPKGSKLTLIVGKGSGSYKVPLPDLVGEEVENAIAMLHKAGLNVAPLKYKPESTDPKGTVILQRPAFSASDSITVGFSVTLFIAGEEPDEPLEIQDFGNE